MTGRKGEDPARSVPHSLEAEKALLGAILVDQRAWPTVASLVRQEDFFRVAHQLIFGACKRLSVAGVPPEFVTLVEELRRSEDLREVGGPAYLSSLADGMPKSVNVEHYASIIRNKAQLRLLIVEGQQLVDAAYEDKTPATEVIDECVKRVMASVGADRHGLVDVGEAVRAYVAEQQSGANTELLMTGYVDVDALIGGFRPADLVIVAARPSVGKTSFALGIAQSVAKAEHAKGSSKVVPFFSLEMRASGLAERLLAWASGVSMQDAIRGTATLDQYASIVESQHSYDDVPIKIQETAGSLTEIEAWCVRLQQDTGIACVVVDYLQLLASETKQSSMEQEVSGISRGLKRLAKRLNVPMIVLSQLSRAPEGRADKRPHLSDLRGSGALEQDADIAVLLFRPELHERTEDNDGICEVIVSKHRAGPTGVVRVAFIKALAQFRNLAGGAE